MPAGRRANAKAKRERARATDFVSQLARAKDHGEASDTLAADSNGIPVGVNGRRGRPKLADDKARRRLMVVSVMWAWQGYQL